MIMDPIQERISQVIAYFSGGNRSDFANMMGVSPQTVSSWGVRPIGINIVNKICDCVPALNKDWLWKGEGDMFKPDIKPQVYNCKDRKIVSISNGHSKNQSINTINDSTAHIEVINKQLDIIRDLQAQLSKAQDTIAELIHKLP